MRQRTRSSKNRALTNEHVVYDLHNRRSSLHLNENACRQIVDKRVVDYIEFLRGIRRTFKSISDQSRIVCDGTLLDNIPDDIGCPPIGKVNIIAGVSVSFVCEAVIENIVRMCTTFDKMTDVRVMRVTKIG